MHQAIRLTESYQTLKTNERWFSYENEQNRDIKVMIKNLLTPTN
jgi:hypothetical protein